MDKEMIVALEKSISELTGTLQSKMEKFDETSSEVRELKAKVAEVAKELSERKHQFDVQKALTANHSKEKKVELETRLDEIVLFKALCHDVETKQFNKTAFEKLTKIPVYAEALKAFGDVSAMQTGDAGTGAEFIPTGFSSTLYEEIWLKLEVAQLFGRIPMPTPTYKLPFAPGRMIAKAAAEGGTVAKVKGVTDQLTFTAKKIMSITEFTDEMDQDSIIPVLNFLRGQVLNAFALAQESMCVNGDTGTSIYSSALTGEDCRKLVKGIRAHAMGTGAKVDFGAASGFTEANLRALRAALGKYGKTPSELAYVMTLTDYFKALAFDGYQKLNEIGSGAVRLAGELGKLDGVPIIVTELLPMAGAATDAADAPGGLNVSGVWDNTTKTKTTCVCVNRTGFLWGDRKNTELELWRNPMNQATSLIGSQRLDFEFVGSDTAKMASVGYNY